jgi:hypothetical protein
MDPCEFVCGGTERGVALGAQDETVPRLVHRMRRHPYHLIVAHRRTATAQPLPQTGLHQLPRLPRTCLEDGLGQFECGHDFFDIAQIDSAPWTISGTQEDHDSLYDVL